MPGASVQMVLGGGLSTMHRVDLGRHERDFLLIPRWRPICSLEIFDDENRSSGVVFPPNQLQNEIATDQNYWFIYYLCGRRR